MSSFQSPSSIALMSHFSGLYSSTCDSLSHALFPSAISSVKEHRHKASLCARKKSPERGAEEAVGTFKKKKKEKRIEQKEITKETESNGIIRVITLSFSLTDIQILIETGSERDWVEERESRCCPRTSNVLCSATANITMGSFRAD